MAATTDYTKATAFQDLIDELEQKKIENNQLKETVKRLNTSLARAENRIAQLYQLKELSQNKDKTCVTPGVSKRILEALVREITKLQLIVDHHNTDGNRTLSTEIQRYQTIKRLEIENQTLRENEEALIIALTTTDSDILQQEIVRLTESEKGFKTLNKLF